MRCQNCGCEVVTGFHIFWKRVIEKISKVFKKRHKKQVVRKIRKKRKTKKSNEKTIKLCSSVKSLSKYKKDLRLCNVALAKELGISDTCLHAWFSGKSKPTKKNRVKIRKFLKNGSISKTRTRARKSFNPWAGLTPEQAQERKDRIAKGVKEATLKRSINKNREVMAKAVGLDPYTQRVKADTEIRERKLKEELEKLKN